jgi:hypothetical protein
MNDPSAAATATAAVPTDAHANAVVEDAVVVVDHWIQPNDTFQGLCLHYGITATQLRRANYGFSGTNLSLAPNPLKVPRIHVDAVPSSSTSSPGTALSVPPPKTTSLLPHDSRRKQGAVAAVRSVHPELARTEARCYLELNNWNVTDAVNDYRKDIRIKQEEAWNPNGEVARFDTPIEYVAMDDEDY